MYSQVRIFAAGQLSSAGRIFLAGSQEKIWFPDTLEIQILAIGTWEGNSFPLCQ